ncbi:MAG: SRPBCC family protein [Acidimicrobiia bacterium]|nr:SRPBCC family protein [Acidimicrobiia bacterium]
MTRLIETATTSLSQEEAFGYVAEFENIDQWDPGVSKSVKSIPGDTAVGTAYDLDLSYRGRSLKMTYTVTEWEPNHRVVLEGVGGPVKAIDTITFVSGDDGTIVTYQADLSLRGIAKLIQPLMGSRLNAVGEAAGQGLRTWLAELERQHN